MDDYQRRKQQRKDYYERFVKGWKQRDCTSCSGSGYYDHNRSPKCGACDDTGKETYKPELGN